MREMQSSPTVTTTPFFMTQKSTGISQRSKWPMHAALVRCTQADREVHDRCNGRQWSRSDTAYGECVAVDLKGTSACRNAPYAVITKRSTEYRRRGKQKLVY